MTYVVVGLHARTDYAAAAGSAAADITLSNALEQGSDRPISTNLSPENVTPTRDSFLPRPRAVSSRTVVPAVCGVEATCIASQPARRRFVDNAATPIIVATRLLAPPHNATNPHIDSFARFTRFFCESIRMRRSFGSCHRARQRRQRGRGCTTGALKAATLRHGSRRCRRVVGCLC